MRPESFRESVVGNIAGNQLVVLGLSVGKYPGAAHKEVPVGTFYGDIHSNYRPFGGTEV